MKKTIVLLFLLLSTSIFSQEKMVCNARSTLYTNYKEYIPDDDFPEFIINLNFIFLQRDDGCCGFSKDNPEHMDIVEKTMNHINDKYSHLVDPKDDRCYKADDFVADTKIRFHLNEIIEIQDDYAWNLDNGSSCPNDRNWFLNKIDTTLQKDPRYADCVNVYFPNSLARYEAYESGEDDLINKKKKPGCSRFPSKKKMNMSSRICMPNYYTKYLDMKHNVVNDTVVNKGLLTWEGGIYYWFWQPLASGLAHELGHSLGLGHSNEHHGPNICKYSILNQSYKSLRNYLPPTEIGKIHRNLRMSSIRNKLYKEVYYNKPWIIKKDMIIDVDYKVYEDIIIEEGVVLKVDCNLEMSPNTKIILKKDAVLDLSVGTIHPVKNYSWRGVEIKKKRGCFLRKKQGVNKVINSGNLFGVD